MATYYLPQAEFESLLSEQQAAAVFGPTETRRLTWLDAGDKPPTLAAMSAPRSAQSPKGLFLPAAESVGRYGPDASAGTAVDVEKIVLVGVRACELRARNYFDKVMLEGTFEDAEYRARRDATTTVSVDCADCTETCCCTLVGGQPFATEGYDVNLTPAGDGYVADVATDKGRQWLGDHAGKLAPASAEQLARRDKLRQEMTERVRKQNEAFDFVASDTQQPKLPNDEGQGWQRFAADCVECGACTNICPTCHCFYLYDQALGPAEFERLRTWDSCLLSTYHRMAGGVGMKLTPRPSLFSRLANRVLHKFTYSPEQYGLLGCVGCGRCIDACLGAIDIRQVVQELKE